MLGEVARKTHDLRHPRYQPPDHRVGRIETRLHQPFRQHLPPIPPTDALGQPVHLVGGQPQGAAHVAQGAARPVADHGGGQCRPVPAILPVDVLDHLFTAMVLEVHIDVRRLVALLRQEALEQHLHARRVHLGDPQGEADRRIGRRATPLAEDAPRAGEAHDVVHGEEIGLITQLSDQRQFVLDQPSHLLRHPSRPAPPGARLHQPAQVGGGGEAGRHQFVRVFIAQLVQGEGAALGDAQRLRQQRRRIEPRQHRPRAQVALSVGLQLEPRLRQGYAQTDGGEGILEGLALRRVHPHPARSRYRQPETRAQPLRLRQPASVLPPPQLSHTDPEAFGETRPQPTPLLVRHRLVPWRQPEGEAPLQPRLQIGPRQSAGPLLRPPPAAADERREPPVTRPVLRQQHQPGPLLKADLTAHDQVQPARLRLLMRPHHPRQGAEVGERQRRIA